MKLGGGDTDMLKDTVRNEYNLGRLEKWFGKKVEYTMQGKVQFPRLQNNKVHKMHEHRVQNNWPVSSFVEKRSDVSI